MGSADYLAKHDYNVICDQCHFKYKASRCRKQEWNNLFVCRKCWESRHPQDFAVSIIDQQNVPICRPDITIYV